MSESNGTKILLAFVAGAAVGVAIGYYLNSDRKDEIFNDLKEGATRLRDDLGEHLDKAKEMVDNFRKQSSDPTTENPE
jgi:F0F1-type ATP synthase assembly protein I